VELADRTTGAHRCRHVRGVRTPCPAGGGLPGGSRCEDPGRDRPRGSASGLDPARWGAGDGSGLASTSSRVTMV